MIGTFMSHVPVLGVIWHFVGWGLCKTAEVATTVPADTLHAVADHFKQAVSFLFQCA